MIYSVNTDYIFTLNNVNVEELSFWSFLEGIVKDSVNLVRSFFKTNYIMCCQEDFIYFNNKE